MVRTVTALVVLASGLMLTGVHTAWAQDKSFTCNPIDVGDFPNSRIHVRCSPDDGGISWFALGVSNEAEASRALSIAATAFAANKKLTIWYDPADLSGGSFGCNTSNCRIIKGIRMF